VRAAAGPPPTIAKVKRPRNKRINLPRPAGICNESMTRPSSNVHATAIVDPLAKIAGSCQIGPYCVIGADVELGEGCRLISHVSIDGPTKIGAENSFFPFSAIGMAPQDVSYKGEPTRLEIGDYNEIRECVTINRGTVKGGGLTKVGSNVLIMAYTHIGHDTVVGDHAMLINGATIAGHVLVEEWAVVGALCAVHQFTRIGAHSYIGGGTVITQDVLPFSMTSAARDVHAYGLNKVGLERRGFSKERIRKIHHAYKILLASKMNTSQALKQLKAEADGGGDVELLIRFIENAERGVVK
jgi:UDP-N-acetylglucosamine acyltransferase